MSSYRKHKKKHGSDGVSLNLAAMLDMAFQLLTFFILTFKPAPVEAQVQLRLPPPKAISGAGGVAAGADESKTDPTESVKSLVITVIGNKLGKIEQIAVGENSLGKSLKNLETKVHGLLGDEGNPFEQVIIQAGSSLHYEELMSVVDVCTRAKLPNGEKLSKLSFVELPTGE